MERTIGTRATKGKGISVWNIAHAPSLAYLLPLPKFSHQAAQFGGGDRERDGRRRGGERSEWTPTRCCLPESMCKVCRWQFHGCAFPIELESFRTAMDGWTRVMRRFKVNTIPSHINRLCAMVEAECLCRSAWSKRDKIKNRKRELHKIRNSKTASPHLYHCFLSFLERLCISSSPWEKNDGLRRWCNLTAQDTKDHAIWTSEAMEASIRCTSRIILHVLPRNSQQQKQKLHQQKYLQFTNLENILGFLKS